MIALLVLAVMVAPLDDPRQEARAQALEQEIRCVVCENEPISQSTADIAADMRREVRAQIASGASDSDIRAFFRERYGDFVLLRPPLDARTWALWLAPLGLLAFGLIGLGFMRRRPEAAGQIYEPEQGER